MVSDPIGDYIIRLKNAGRVGHAKVISPYSKLRHAIAETLQQAGYLTAVAVSGEGVGRKLISTLAYGADGSPAINGVKRLSKPGRRLYRKVEEIHPVKFGKGDMIMSTPAGILTGSQARSQHVGGEQLFIIW